MTVQQQSALADEAFEGYNFGDGVEVTDFSGWEYTTPGHVFSRKVFVETAREDDSAAPRWTLTFTVRFDEQSGTLAEAYAADSKGQVWGSFPAEGSTSTGGLSAIACVKSVSAGQAAVDAHQSVMLCDGEPSVQLWHLLASLHEWAAARGVDFDAELKEFQDTFNAGELNLPAVKALRQSKLTEQAQARIHSRS